MKITKSRLKEIIQEELRRDLLQESRGWFGWREVEKVLAERDEEGEVTRDLVEVLQEMGRTIGTYYPESMNKYDMESMDFFYDVIGNYEDELGPYRGDYPDMDENEMAEILAESTQEALDKEEEYYKSNLDDESWR